MKQRTDGPLSASEQIIGRAYRYDDTFNEQATAVYDSDRAVAVEFVISSRTRSTMMASDGTVVLTSGGQSGGGDW